jgi:hypothetical protein
MAKSNVDIKIGDKNTELSIFENMRIKDREMIPEWNIFSKKATETIYSPDLGEDGSRKMLGISVTIETNSVITLRPEEYYLNKKNGEEDVSVQK